MNIDVSRIAVFLIIGFASVASADSALDRFEARLTEAYADVYEKMLRKQLAERQFDDVEFTKSSP